MYSRHICMHVLATQVGLVVGAYKAFLAYLEFIGVNGRVAMTLRCSIAD